MGLIVQIAKILLIVVLCALWALATVATVWMAYESGSRILWACSASLFAVGTMIMAFLSPPRGRFRILVLPALLAIYSLLAVSFYLHTLLAFLLKSGQ